MSQTNQLKHLTDPPRYLFASGVMVALAIGAVVGFIAGHFASRSADSIERMDAEARANEAEHRARVLETRLADVTIERDRERGEREAATPHADRSLADVRKSPVDSKKSHEDALGNHPAFVMNDREEVAKRREEKFRQLQRPGLIALTTKDIETNGSKYTTDRCQFVCSIREISDVWVRLLLRDDAYMGLMVLDSKGQQFQFAFANKEKLGKELADLKKGDVVCLVGTISFVGARHVFKAEEIYR